MTAQQIDSLPRGFFPNRLLRTINPKHGHVVPALDRDGFVTEFIGNRSQYLAECRNPVRGKSRPKISAAKHSAIVGLQSIWFRIRNFIRNLFQ